VPDPASLDAGLPADAVERLVGFGRYLRGRGLPIGTGRILTFCRAAATLGPFDRTDLWLAARATLVSRPEDYPLLEAAFDRYFGTEAAAAGSGGDGSAPEAPPRRGDRPTDVPAGPEGRQIITASRWSTTGDLDVEDDEEQSAIRIVASDVERLRDQDFAELTPEERRRASILIRRMALSLPFRPSRRFRPGPAGRRFDMRRTLRRSLRTEGEPFRRAWLTRQTRQRPLVLVLDVSGSMAPYARPLVEFAHAASVVGRRVEAFCFGTRLTRITRAVRRRDPAEALAAVGKAVSDWEGGTRIGESLKSLLDEWSNRSSLRGSVVVLCSDGLERGDPELLARQMQRLGRLAHRVIWMNPLKGSPRYEPLARGMAASLPYVNVFLPGHNLESLEELTRAVALA
jgi:uncharacterized protein with von Willebrand factor type A (vWA) domain